jgi:hypothetical protein
VLELIGLYERHRSEAPPDDRPFPPALRLLVVALVVARTPRVPLPERPAAPPATREAAEPEEAAGPR